MNRKRAQVIPDGADVSPADRAAEGVARARGLKPLDTTGLPSVVGKIVLLSIGMSNTTQEFCSEDSIDPCDARTSTGKATG